MAPRASARLPKLRPAMILSVAALLPHAAAVGCGGEVECASISEVRSALAEVSQDGGLLDATLKPDGHAVSSPLVVDTGKTLVLRGYGAELDAGKACRHFLVQDGGVLELEGVKLVRGFADDHGGCVLARRHAQVRLLNASLDSCEAEGDIAARGGSIALGMYSPLVNLAKGTLYESEQSGEGTVFLAWSPVRNHFATGSYDGRVALWDGHNLGDGALRTQFTTDDPQVQDAHTGMVSALAWSPDGNTLLSGSHDQTVILWNAFKEGTDLAFQQKVDLAGLPNALPTEVYAVAWAPDNSGRILIAGNNVQMWRYTCVSNCGASNAAGRFDYLDNLAGSSCPGSSCLGRVNSIAWSPVASCGSTDCTENPGQACYFATGHCDPTFGCLQDGGAVRMWKCNGDELPGGHESMSDSDDEHQRGVHSLAFNENGCRLVSGSNDYTIKAWRASDLTTTPLTGVGHLRAVTSVAFNPEGDRLASTSEDGLVKIWGIDDFGIANLATGDGFSGFLNAVGYSHDGKMIATGAASGQVRTWDRGDVANAFIGDTPSLEGHVRSVSFSPDGLRVVSSNRRESGQYEFDALDSCVRGGLRVWDTSSGIGAVLHVDFASYTEVAEEGCSISPIDSPSACGYSPGGTSNCGLYWPIVAKWSPDGAYIVSGSRDGKLRLYDAMNITRGPIKTIDAHEGDSDGVVNGNVTKVVTNSKYDGGYTLAEVTAIAWSPDSTKIVSGGTDSMLRVWSVADFGGACECETGAIASRLVGDSIATVMSVAWGGDTIACGASNALYLLNANSLSLLADISFDKALALAFSPDAKYVAAGANDRTLKLYDVQAMISEGPVPQSGPLATGISHSGAVWGLSFSPDGEKLVSSSEDGTLKVWHAATLASGPLATGGGGVSGARGHTGGVYSVDWSRNGSQIVSGSADMRVIMWTNLTYTQTLRASGSMFNSSQAVVGGAVSVLASEAATTSSGDFIEVAIDLLDSTFTNNDASTSGGALALIGHSAFPSLYSATMNDLTFSANVAGNKGGALFSTSWRFALSGGTFERNAGQDGAAINYAGNEPNPVSSAEGVRFLDNAPNPTVRSGAPIAWTCDTGKYMPRTGIATGSFDGCLPCLLGYFGSASNLTEPTCEAPCIKGHFCPEGSASPLPCANGTYLPSIGAASNETCISCPPGSYALNAGQAECTTCEVGRFSETAGCTRCDECQLGGFCASAGQASALMAWTACPQGTQGVSEGLTNVTQCAACIAGHFCPEGRRGVMPVPEPCSQGTYLPSTNGLSAADCLLCGEGKYNPQTGSGGANECLLCDAGKFNPVKGARREENCQNCTRGSYCEEGSSSPRACLEGRYGEAEGLTDAQCSGACAQGYYCEAGSVSAKAAPCAEGTYGNGTGLKALEECTDCPTGHVCVEASTGPAACRPGTVQPSPRQGRCDECDPGTFMNASGRETCHTCTPGYFCSRSASAPLPCPSGRHQNATLLALGIAMTSAADCVECPEGAFCPTGAARATGCAPGTFNAQPLQPTCENCEAGRFQNETGATACSTCVPGYFCTARAAAPLPCPGGTTMNASLPVMTGEEQCVACDQGKFCPVGSANATACAPGTYNAQTRQATCASCEAGTYQEDAGRTACTECPRGHHCARGAAAALPCPEGTWSNETGVAAEEGCTTCAEGTFCFAGSTAATNCSAGTYAQEAESKLCSACEKGTFQSAEGATACEPCGDGFTCPKGSVVPIPASCDRGTFLNATLAAMLEEPMDACLPCTAGKWCAGGRAAARWCPRGGYCVANASEAAECPAGRFGDVEGLMDAQCSGECARGYYCEAGSVSAKAAPCAEGTYGNGTGLVSQSNCSTCPVGHACPEAATEPARCRSGSVQSLPARGECDTCGAGRFASTSGQTACFECDAGSFCEAGASAALPCVQGTFSGTPGLESAAECLDCPAGSFCVTGALEASACSKGTFAAANRSGLCTICPEGSYNGDEGATACRDCDAGHTCAEGSVAPIPNDCAPGRFSPKTNGSYGGNVTCAGCPDGAWCAGGSTQPRPCSRGAYCNSNASRPSPCAAGRFGNVTALADELCSGACPKGYFCEAGASAPLPCPSGTYGAAEQMEKPSQCRLCTVGHWCATGAAEPAPCAPGSAAAAAGLGACEICSAGTYQAQTNATACDICPRTALCAAGSSAPTPCARGTVGREEGLSEAAQCDVCATGHWCSGGQEIPCGSDTYNSRPGEYNLDACLPCPPNSESPPASGSISNCSCSDGFYNVALLGEVVCEACPTGSECSGAGATLEELPLVRGYYRSSLSSADPRVCPNFAGVNGETRCPGNGGESGTDGTCAGLLSGVYCTAWRAVVRVLEHPTH